MMGHHCVRRLKRIHTAEGIHGNGQCGSRSTWRQSGTSSWLTFTNHLSLRHSFPCNALAHLKTMTKVNDCKVTSNASLASLKDLVLLDTPQQRAR